ncbi:MAG: NADPH-dependent F420 reductase [Candidatus Nitrosocosmicus sp.]
MKIGIIGGTGGMGEGFAQRWCFNHDILIGSRDKQKATAFAKEHFKNVSEMFPDKVKGSISGDDNKSISKDSDVLILSIHYDNIESTCKDISDIIKDNCIIVSPIVPMGRNEHGFSYIPIEEGKRSAASIVAENLPNCNKIVSAFHTISETKLKNLKMPLNADTFVCTDNKESLSIVNGLINEIEGLRSIFLGPLSLSYQAEVITPMILNASKQNKLKHPGIKLV